MKILGLTGSIGMGKTTSAQAFADKGAVVWNADASVARLYAYGGQAVEPIQKAFPDVVSDGAVNKDALKAALAGDPNGFKTLEKIVHPLVQEDRQAFLANVAAPLAVLDIPLLFETNADALCDKTAVVSTDRTTQRARVLARRTMTEELFEEILSRQMADEDKRKRADYVIHTDSLASAQADIDHIWNQMVTTP